MYCKNRGQARVTIGTDIETYVLSSRGLGLETEDRTSFFSEGKKGKKYGDRFIWVDICGNFSKTIREKKGERNCKESQKDQRVSPFWTPSFAKGTERKSMQEVNTSEAEEFERHGI